MPRNQANILPRTRSLARPSRAHRPKAASHQRRSEDEVDTRFRTVLEDIRIPSNQRPKRSEVRVSNPQGSRQCSDQHERNRPRAYLIAARRGPAARRISLRSDSDRYVSGGSTSRDSYSAKKEATFEIHECEDEFERERESDPRPQHLGRPSPGEGLRNALGNLDNRLHRKRSVGRTGSSHSKGVKGDQNTPSEKGFATLVEELIQPRSSGKGTR